MEIDVLDVIHYFKVYDPL